MIPQQVIDWSKFGDDLHIYRTTVYELTLKELAKVMGGITTSALSSLEHQRIAAASTLFWLSPWLNATPDQFYLPSALGAISEPRKLAPLSELVRYTKAAVKEAITVTTAASLSDALETRLINVAGPVICRRILLPPDIVLAPELPLTLSPKQIIDWGAVKEALQDRRTKSSITLEDIAAEIGSFSPASLWRITQGLAADATTLFRLCLWLGVSPDNFYRSTALVTLPLPERTAVLARMATDVAKATETAVRATATRWEVQSVQVDRLGIAVAQTVHQAILTPPTAI